MTPAARPTAPRRLPRVLPTPPRPTIAPAQADARLKAIVHQEVLTALLAAGNRGHWPLAVAIGVSDRVTARYAAEVAKV